MPLTDSIPFCRKEAVRQIPIFPEVQEGAASLASFAGLSIQHGAGRWLGWFLQRRAPLWDLQHPSRDPSGVSL